MRRLEGWISILVSEDFSSIGIFFSRNRLKEDNSYGRDQNALLNASLFRTISLNLLKLNGFTSVAEALTELANQVHRIFSFLV